jgi:glutamate decarboxylase
MPARAASASAAMAVVHDELMLDGNARLNLATFVTTRTAELESRSVAMLAHLWGAPEGQPGEEHRGGFHH